MEKPARSRDGAPGPRHEGPVRARRAGRNLCARRAQARARRFAARAQQARRRPGALARLAHRRQGRRTAHEPPTTRRFDTSVDRRVVDNKETQASTIFEVDVRAGAGGGGVPVEAYVHDAHGNSYAAAAVAAEWTLPETIVQGVLHSAPRHIRVFEVIGDSMEPRLYEGDRVFIDLRYTIPSPEGIFALWDGYGLVIKRLQIVMGSDPMRVRIISVNASYAPYEAGADEIRIVGRFAGRFTVN